jgi:hypothetical protein
VLFYWRSLDGVGNLGTEIGGEGAVEVVSLVVDPSVWSFYGLCWGMGKFVRGMTVHIKLPQWFAESDHTQICLLSSSNARGLYYEE